MWAVLLGIVLALVAALSAHAAQLAWHAPAPRAHVALRSSPAPAPIR